MSGFIGCHAVSPKAIRKLLSALRELVSLPADNFVDQHNNMVMYTLTVGMLTTGHRPTRDPFCYRKDICTETELIRIEDKYSTSNTRRRYVPMVKGFRLQLLEYNDHLLGLLDRVWDEANQEKRKLGKNDAKARQMDQLYSLILNLVQGSSTVNLPYLFLLGEDLSIQSISKKVIETYWKKHVDIEANSGRKNLATLILAQSGSLEIVNMLLGHSPTPLPIINKNTEVSMQSYIEETKTLIEKIFSSIGLEPISGLGKTSKKNHLGIRRPVPDDYPYSHKLLGPEERAQKRFAAKRLFEKDVDTLISILQKGSAAEKGVNVEELLRKVFESNFPIQEKERLILEELSQRFSEVVSTLPMLRTFVHQQDDEIPTDLIPKLNNLYTYRNRWFDVVCNKNKPIDPYGTAAKRKAAVIITAALFGGCYEHDTLRRIASTRATPRLSAFGDLELDISLEDENSNNFYWQPDLFTSALLVGLSRTEGASELTFSEVSKEIQIMLKRIGLIAERWKKTKTNDVYSALATAAGSCAYYELPAYLACYATGRRRKPCLSPLAKSRIATGAVGSLDVEILEERKNEITLSGSKRVSFSPNVATPSRLIILELRRIFNDEQSKESEGKAKHSRIVNKLLAKRIAGIAASHSEAPHICLLHLDWAQSICQHGTQKRETPSLSTLKDYILTTATTLYHEASGIPNFSNLSAEQYQDVYISSLDFNQRMDQHSLLNQYYRFHRHIESKEGAVPLAWSNVWASASLVSGRISSNCVSIEELDRCTDYIESDASLSKNEKIQYAAALVLMRNFGLRFSEAYTLQHNSVQYTSSVDGHHEKDIGFVQIRANNVYKRRGKSGSSVRSIPRLRKLSSKHQGLLETLLRMTELEVKDEQHIGLMRETSGSRALIDRGKMNAYLNNLLKLVSGDSELHVHHLRHSFASDVAAAIARMRYNPTNLKMYPNAKRQLERWENDFDVSKLVFSRENSLALRDLAMALGHADLSTSLAHYIHSIECVETMGNADLFEHKFRYLDGRLTDKVAAAVLNEKYDAYRARKGKLIKNNEGRSDSDGPLSEFAFYNSVNHHIRKLRLSSSNDCHMDPYSARSEVGSAAFKEIKVDPTTIQQIFYYFVNGKDDEMVIERASQIYGLTHNQVGDIYQIAQKSARRSDYLLGPIRNPEFLDHILSERAHKRCLNFLALAKKLIDKMDMEKLALLDNGLDVFISNLELNRRGRRVTKKMIFDDADDRSKYMRMLSYLKIPVSKIHQETSSEDLFENSKKMNFSRTATKTRSRSQYRRDKSFVFRLAKDQLSAHSLGNENTLLHCLFVLYCWRQISQ